MPQQENKTSKPVKKADLYRIEFWKQNNDWNPKLPPMYLIGKEHVYAKSEVHALKLLKARAIKNARELGKTEDHKLMSMFSREDISIRVKKTFDTRILEREQKAEQEDEVLSKSVCKECGEQLDDDYCQECGFRRESWLDKAMAKQGESEANQE